MKRLAVAGLTVALLVATGTAFGIWYARQPSGVPSDWWHEFRPAGCGCRLEMPSQPVPQFGMPKRELATRWDQWICFPVGHDFVNGFMYAELNPEKPSQQLFDSIYADVVKSTLSEMNGILTSESDITSGGHNGKEFQITSPKQHLFITRMYLVTTRAPNRLYMLNAGARKAKPSHRDFTRFFESFKIED